MCSWAWELGNSSLAIPTEGVYILVPSKLLVPHMKYTSFIKDGEWAVVGSFLLSVFDRLKMGVGEIGK